MAPKEAYITRLTDPSPEGIEAAAVVLSDAFGGDRIDTLINGDVPGLAVARMRGTITTAVLDFEAYIASLEGEGGRVDGAMLVSPPGIDRASAHSDNPKTAIAKKLQPPELLAAITQLKNHFELMEHTAYGPHGVRDTYYISHLGVAPAAAGNNVGGQLLNFLIKRANKERKGITLLTMSERHVEYYGRFGFKSDLTLPLNLSGQHTDWWAMSIKAGAE